MKSTTATVAATSVNEPTAEELPQATDQEVEQSTSEQLDTSDDPVDMDIACVVM
ncbi:MAG: hypothetical protein M1833_006112 [Piccolia ochrophora]|nr:MAG: hypothetical protein M1833_006112 [Piccolia ochrophora]